MPDTDARLKIAHVVPSFYPAHSFGGPTESVYNLCRAVSRAGAEVRVLTTDTNGPSALDVDTGRDVELADGVYVRYCRRVAGISISPGLLWHLSAYIRWADVVHVTAVYSFPTIPALALARVFRKPVVWSPRGSLERWDNSSRVVAKAIWERLCRILAPSATVLHVTSEPEKAASIERMHLRADIIENGVSIPSNAEHSAFSGVLRLLYLGRLVPQKGIESLVDACGLLRDSGTPFTLRLVGDGEQRHLEQLRRRITELQLSEVVEMTGYLGGDDKEHAFRDTDVLVLPSFRENFGMAVAEALARGIPVVVGKGAPWGRVEEEHCGMWVNNDPHSLAQAIRRISQKPLRAMGMAGRDWMTREFSWDSVAARMLTLYRALADPSRTDERAMAF